MEQRASQQLPVSAEEEDDKQEHMARRPHVTSLDRAEQSFLPGAARTSDHQHVRVLQRDTEG